MTKEIWKEVAGYSGWYEVSDLGRVRSWRKTGRKDGKKRQVPRILRPWKTIDGYMRAILSGDGGTCQYSVHRLVAQAFLGPVPEGRQVDHINDCRANNVLSNLQYLTPSENTRKGAWKRAGEKNYGSILKEEDILTIRKRYVLSGETASAIAADFGVAEGTIAATVQGRNWKHIPVVSSPPDASKPVRGRRFTPKDITAIRERYAAGATQSSIAKDFGVRQGAISLIVRRKTWKHVK